jgi:hypothetical protein
VELEVRPETLTSLFLIPFIEVAWATGSVDDEERKVILMAAQEVGIRQGNVDFDLIQQWTTIKPLPHLIKAWIRYIYQLCKKLTPEQKRIVKYDILEHTSAVANASGGILNLGIENRIAATQAEVIKKLEDAFEK